MSASPPYEPGTRSTVTRMVAVRALAAFAATSLAAASLTMLPATAAPPPAPGAKVNQGKPPCTGVPDLTGKRPGRLLRARELPVPTRLLTGARLYRILYTSSGVDETDVEAVCGLVALPAKKRQRVNEVVAWAHGTIGMHQSCQPSNAPNSLFLGPMAGGIGAIAYGSGRRAVSGKATYGALQTLIDQGRMVAATDYYAALGRPGTEQQHYVLGVPAGAAVLDSARAASQLARRLGTKPRTWKLATWGHSQGGHAALWAGQLARDYIGATRTGNDPRVELVGVAALAPATSFVATATTPPDLIGRHLGDLGMHAPASTVGGQAIGTVGPLLFSLVATAWAGYPGAGTPGGSARFPGYPAQVTPPQITEVLTAQGLQTAKAVTAGCLDASAATEVITYGDPARNAFFVQPVWGGPGPDGRWQGALDTTCLDPATGAALQAWCTWLAYNQPGPDGRNPFAKIPLRADGSYADVLLAQGMADTIVYCRSPGSAVPTGVDCLSRQYYDSLAPACSTAGVRLTLFAERPRSPASHTSVAGQIADNGRGRFAGSPLATFLDAAFRGSLKPGCRAQVRRAG